MLFRSLCLLATATLTAAARPPMPLEPIDLPPSVQQGVDLIYIDPEIAPAIRQRDALAKELGLSDEAGGGVDLLLPMNPLYTQLRRGLMSYRASWSGLPQVGVEAGPALKIGTTGERVARLRERLGLNPAGSFNAELGKAVQRYQEAHGIKADGIAGVGTIASLNLGAAHYERLLLINLERARRLPGTSERGRYILVDAGAARLYMFQDGKVQDSMKVIVGKTASATPMMAASIRYASVNPFWNVPPDLARTLIAPKVLSEGLGHLKAERYEVLSDWSPEASVVDPTTVDWKAVADGIVELRMRQLPGRGNSMGEIKFMMPNDYGIYLHDTPDKTLFAKDERWISNGCVRVEDARRLAKWVFGAMPKGSNPDAEEDVQLDKPVPVYITYLTADASSKGAQFRKDPYGRDAPLLARYGPARELAAR